MRRPPSTDPSEATVSADERVIELLAGRPGFRPDSTVRDFAARLIRGPGFGAYYGLNPTWRPVSSLPGGLHIEWFNGLSGIYLDAHPSGTELAGRAYITSELVVRDSAGAFSDLVAETVVRVTRTSCSQ